tara:strand:+ start:519 stop:1133 length:615 start_codon:yes stop_codon:yes gene_type:complete
MTGIISDNVGRTSGLIKAASGGGGVWTLISTFTSDGSDATATFDSDIDSTYPIYVFKWINIHPETDATHFQVNFRDGSTAYDATKTTTAFKGYHDESDSTAELAYRTGEDLTQSTSALIIQNNIDNANDASSSGELWLFSPSSTTFVKHFISRAINLGNSDAASDWFVGGYCNVTAAIDGVQFSMSSGEIQDGKIKMYGLKDSA